MGSGFGLIRGSSPDHVDALIGTTLGRFFIERRIASGGMGTVYLATRADGEFKQDVAIKVVKRGMDSEEILRRFRFERRTLAALDHPNIARLIDGGATPDGQPYLVMEYVDGAPIDQYCDTHKLGTEARLALFRTVCEAVRYAHQNLVVHRDLKPSNILVTADGTSKLLDFGISKVIAGVRSAEMTTAEERRLTPEYASPEQIAGLPVTTATDVYSLGIILYELLTGRRPYLFRTRTTAEFERVICHENPPAPSTAVVRPQQATTVDGESRPPVTPQAVGETRNASPERLRRRLKGDLDTIVLMAMRKAPERRYASVEQFSEDIHRYLTNRPVIARKETPAYLAVKFVRRNAWATASAAAVALLLIAGVAAVAWQAQVAKRERDAAYVARDQSEAIADFLQTMLASADPNNDGPDAKIRAVLDAAAISAEADLAGRPLVQAAVRSAIGRTYLGLGLYEIAESHLREAYRTRLSLLGPDHHDVAESKLDMSHLYYAQGRYDQAEVMLRESLETHRTQRGENNIDTARVWNDLGAVLRLAKKFEEAEAAHRRALEIRQSLAPKGSIEVAESLNNLSGVQRAKGDLEQAEASMLQALEMRRALLRPDHPLVAQAAANLGVMKASRGDLAGAEPLMREALTMSLRVLGPEHPNCARSMNSLATVLRLKGEFEEALPFIREALRIQRAHLPKTDPAAPVTQANLARCLVELTRHEEAEALLSEAVNQLKEIGEPARAQFNAAAEDLAKLYDTLGRAEDAERTRGMVG